MGANFCRHTVNGITVGETLVHQIVCRHGCPSTLICDNASYYVHGEFPKLCKILGIRAAPVAAYHPEANGIAEAKVKALKRLLRSLVKTEFNQWDKYQMLYAGVGARVCSRCVGENVNAIQKGILRQMA